MLLKFLVIWFVIENINCRVQEANDTFRRYKRQADCTADQFSCTTIGCVDSTVVCDGVKNCNDGSDETKEQCSSIKCPKFSFQCDYGACVDKEYRCDGVVQCIDGSDESTRICIAKTTTSAITYKFTSGNQKPTRITSAVTYAPVTTTTEAPGSCKLPAKSADKSFNITCPTGDTCGNAKKVPPFTSLNIKCKNGYANEEGSYRTFCFMGEWQPKITNCVKTCNPLIGVNMDMTCTRKGEEVDCAKQLLDGTKLRPKCKPQYREEQPPTYREIICEDGIWDNILYKCVPDCGKPYSPGTTLIVNGSVEKYGDSPWHVAIYDKHKILICGGTIITPYLVLSAAHCTFDKNNDKSYPASNYEIVVSKYTRNYTVKDNEFQQIHQVTAIHYSDRGYHGLLTLHASDISLIEVKTKIILSPTVLPACVEWSQTDEFKPPDGTLGKVVGWGVDDSGKVTGSEVLLAALLPYVSYDTCLKHAPETFKQYITLDKFCAGALSGPGVRQGDSGGGLLFQKASNSLYYVYGIVSIKDASNVSIAAFTDVMEHLEWINTIKTKVEKQRMKDETVIGYKV